MSNLHSVRHDLRDRFAGDEHDLLDMLASNARTALDDPVSVGLEDADALQMRAALNRATRAASSRDVGKVLAETSAVSLGLKSFETRHAYAIEQCDAIIEALNPSMNDRATFAATLTLLGRHLAERMDRMDVLIVDTVSPDTDAYKEAVRTLGDCLDALDVAIGALQPEPA